MGQIYDIMKEFNPNWHYNTEDIRKWIQKHLEPQKKVEDMKIQEEWVKRWKPWLKPWDTYYLEPQQEDKKDDDILRCVKCWNSIKWDYDDEYCCECWAEFKQQEDKKIEPLSKVYKKTYWEWDEDILADKIDEIINYINLHLDHKSL